MLTLPQAQPLSFLSLPLPMHPRLWAHNWSESLCSEGGREVGEILGLLAGFVVREGSPTDSIIYSNEYL